MLKHLLTLFAGGLLSEREQEVLPEALRMLDEVDMSVFGIPSVLLESDDPKIAEVRSALRDLGLLEEESCSL
jgi:hypothetical protein